MKKRLLIAIIPIAILVVGPWVVPHFVSWSAINCRTQEINIKTGQARSACYLWYIKVSERTEDTILSKVLAGESVDVADVAPWCTVNIYSPGSHCSVHPKFHGALYQAAEVELYFGIVKPDAQRQKQIVQELLTLWQTSGGYLGASEYLKTLLNDADQSFEGKRRRSLPEPNAPIAQERDIPTDHRWRQA